MSGPLTVAAGYLDHLPLSHKLALMKIADSAEHESRVGYPGLDAIRLWSGAKRSRALEILRELQEMGLVMQVEAGRRGTRASYKVFPDPGDEAHGLAVRRGQSCPGAALFKGVPGVPSADEVEARVAVLDGAKGAWNEAGAAAVAQRRKREKGSGQPDPFKSSLLQDQNLQDQDAAALFEQAPAPETESAPSGRAKRKSSVKSAAAQELDARAERFTRTWWDWIAANTPERLPGQSYISVKQVVRTAMANHKPDRLVEAGLNRIVASGWGISGGTLTKAMTDAASHPKAPEEFRSFASEVPAQSTNGTRRKSGDEVLAQNAARHRVMKAAANGNPTDESTQALIGETA